MHACERLTFSRSYVRPVDCFDFVFVLCNVNVNSLSTTLRTHTERETERNAWIKKKRNTDKIQVMRWTRVARKWTADSQFSIRLCEISYSIIFGDDSNYRADSDWCTWEHYSVVSSWPLLNAIVIQAVDREPLKLGLGNSAGNNRMVPMAVRDGRT